MSQDFDYVRFPLAVWRGPIGKDRNSLLTWMSLLFECLHEGQRARFGHKVIDVRAGEAVVKARELAAAAGCSAATVRSKLSFFQSAGLIEVKAIPGSAYHVRICDWSRYAPLLSQNVHSISNAAAAVASSPITAPDMADTPTSTANTHSLNPQNAYQHTEITEERTSSPDVQYTPSPLRHKKQTYQHDTGRKNAA